MCVSFPEVTDNKSLPSHPPYPTRGVSLIFKKKGTLEGSEGGDGDRAGVMERVRERRYGTKARAKNHIGGQSVVFKGRQFFFITTQRYRSSRVIKVSLTVWLQALYRYSSRARQSSKNLEDKVGDDRKRAGY